MYKYIRKTTLVGTLAMLSVASYAQSTLEDGWKALRRYDIESAQAAADRAEKASRKGRKSTPLPSDYEEFTSAIEKVTNALERVEAIEIIDSVTVSKIDFFKSYAMGSSAGSFHSPRELPKGFAYFNPTAVYASEDSSMLIWAAPDKAHKPILVESDMLSDGTYSAPTPLKGDFEGTELNWPWLSTDGVTLYFAALNQEDGLGGYDIYMTRRDEDGYLKPQNIGMPYNSPYDDYLLAIDEQRGLGWWATDRWQIPGKVTVYTFIPQDLRNNFDSSRDDIASLALAANIKATHKSGKDYTSILKEAKEGTGRKATVKAEQFRLSVPGVGVLTNFSQFHSNQARELMDELLSMEKSQAKLRERLVTLRREYKLGRNEFANDILQAEEELESSRVKLVDLRNDVIRAEQGAQ